MSWGDLVARLVREAVARHDPRGGGSGQRRRRSAGSAGASPRPAPNKTRAAGAADAPAQRVHEFSRRASKTRRPAGAAAGPVQRVSESSRRAPNRTRAAAAPAAPAQRGGGATPAPPGDTAATERQNPIAMLANAAPPSQSGPAALLDGARADGVPSGAPAAAAAPQSGPAAPLDGARGGGAPSGAPVATAAPKFASDALADGSHAGAAVPGSPVATSAPERALGVSPDGGPSGASAGAAAHTTRDSVHNSHQSPPRRHIPAAVRRHVWQRDGGRCCYRDPLTGRRCTSSHLLQIDHLLPVAQGGWPGAVQPQSAVRSSPQNAPRPRVGCAAGATDVAPPPRCCRAARLRWPTACRWPAGTHCTWWRSWTGRTGGFAAPRAERASSLPPHQNLAGRCRRAHARRCRGLTSTNSCRFRRSHP